MLRWYPDERCKKKELETGLPSKSPEERDCAAALNVPVVCLSLEEETLSRVIYLDRFY